MFIYSEKIIRFIQEVKILIKNVLSKEIGVKVTGNRFFDLTRQFSYPLSVVVYNDRSMLGYFDPNFYELGFHENLMHTSKEQLLNTIRHELAHYMTFIEYQYQVSSHGPEFRSFCLKMGWGAEVYSATTLLADEQKIASIEESDILRKVQKLTALSSSSNKNEAEAAMIKSQQLLLKHNIESKYIGSDSDEKIYLKRVLKQSQKNTRLRAIAKILETFFVSVVFNRGSDGIYLEILGNAVNVQIAEYVAGILQDKLEDLWDLARQEHRLKGLVAKNSFFLGVAKGYCLKVDALKRAYKSEETTALMTIEGMLQKAQSMVYEKLSSSKSQNSYCPESSKLGEVMGKGLNINPGVSSSKNLGKLIESH